MTDDAELLRQYAQNGSETAFAELVGRPNKTGFKKKRRSRDQNNLTAENPKGAEMTGILFACFAFFAVMILWLFRFALFSVVSGQMRFQSVKNALARCVKRSSNRLSGEREGKVFAAASAI